MSALATIKRAVAEEIFASIETLRLFPKMGTPLQDEWQGFRKLTVRPASDYLSISRGWRTDHHQPDPLPGNAVER